jgi:hypothetical protein
MAINLNTVAPPHPWHPHITQHCPLTPVKRPQYRVCAWSVNMCVIQGRRIVFFLHVIAKLLSCDLTNPHISFVVTK